MFLLVCNVYLLITDANILLLYDNGLNFEHLTKKKGVLNIMEYCKKLKNC